MSKSSFTHTPWATAIAASPRPAEPGSYDVAIPQDWSIANLPLGGYLNSLLTSATRAHFALHHAALAQPDPINSHCAFISRAVFGPGIVRIAVSKSGRQYSNVLARLYQPALAPATKKDKSSKNSNAAAAAAAAADDEVLVAEALITQGNLARERASGGISLPIENPLPRSEMFPRASGIELVDPPEWQRFAAASTKIRRLFPPGTGPYVSSLAHPEQGPGVREEWIKWDAERSGLGEAEAVFDVQALPLLMDDFRPPAYDFEGIEMTENWMATLSITTDVKKGPPEGRAGWEWLFLRVVMGRCNFGRYSMDIMLLDEEGDVVAVGRRADIILGEARRSERSGGKSRM